jgi:hypothetical protein
MLSSIFGTQELRMRTAVEILSFQVHVPERVFRESPPWSSRADTLGPSNASDVGSQ